MDGVLSDFPCTIKSSVVVPKSVGVSFGIPPKHHATRGSLIGHAHGPCRFLGTKRPWETGVCVCVLFLC